MAHFSILSMISSDKRTLRAGSCPVAGRPGLRFCVTDTVDFAMYLSYINCRTKARREDMSEAQKTLVIELVQQAIHGMFYDSELVEKIEKVTGGKIERIANAA